MPLKPLRSKQRAKEIRQDAKKASDYVSVSLQGRWPGAESIIMKHPEAAYYYALNGLKQRWPAAEPYIMKDAFWAAEYAQRVIKGRWPEAEPIIMKDKLAKLRYDKIRK